MALCSGRVLTVERGRLRRWGHCRDNGMLLGDSSGLILHRPADYGGKWLRTFYQSLVPGVLCGDDRLQAQSRFVRAHSSCCCCTKDRSRILLAPKTPLSTAECARALQAASSSWPHCHLPACPNIKPPDDMRRPRRPACNALGKLFMPDILEESHECKDDVMRRILQADCNYWSL